MNAICGVHMAESLLVCRNFLSGICKLKPKKNLFFSVKKAFYRPWNGCSGYRKA